MAIFLLLQFGLSAYALDMKDASVQVEMHDRLGRVRMAKGVFVSGIGEFAVLKSVIEPALKDPYDYTMSFKTTDDRPLTDIQFSHCEKKGDESLCFYKANYIPYRKIELGSQNSSLKGDENLLYHQSGDSIAGVKLERHPQKDLFWATGSRNQNIMPGTLLLDNKGKPQAIVTEKKMRNSHLIVPISSLSKKDEGKGYHPIEQQSSQSIPKHMEKKSSNMSRMVADITKMSEEQLKKAIEELFVPGGVGARSGLKKRSDNNRFSKTAKEEVAIQASSRGDEARRDFFKLEQKAVAAQKEIENKDDEIGELEKKIKGKEALHGVLQMKVDGAKESFVSQSVKLEVAGNSLTEEEKAKLKEEIAGSKEKLEQAQKKLGGVDEEIGQLKEKLKGLKLGLAKNKVEVDKLMDEAKKAAQKNAEAIQGSKNYRGDLL